MKAVIPVALALLIAACATARRSEPIAGPFMPQTAALQQGERLFDRHCNKCHVGGEAGLGPAINNKPLPKALMRTQIRVGMGTMPSMKKDEISDADVDLVLDYLEALRKHRAG
jgi:mono/diheme cytochrome c family protein